MTSRHVVKAGGQAVGARAAPRLRKRYHVVRGLKDLRLLAKRSQGQMAEALRIAQPSVLKMERQDDLYVSTLRRFVEAAGGTLTLRVELPGQGILHVIRIEGLGEAEA